MHITWITGLDASSSLFSLLATLCAIRVKRITWFWTFLACLANIVLYDVERIYGQMLLQWIYMGMAAYGWWYWMEHQDKAQNKRIQLIESSHVVFALLFIMGSASLWYVFLSHTDSSTLWMDALTTGIFLTAQILACQKKILNWCLWFLADVLCIFLYAGKGLMFHTLLFSSYLFFASWGYWTWYKMARQHQKDEEDQVVLACREEDSNLHGVAPTST